MSPRDVQVPPRIDGHGIVVVDALLPWSCDGSDDTVRVDLAHARIRSIGDIDVAVLIESHSSGLVQSGVYSGSAVSVVAIEPRSCSRAGHQTDGSIRCDLAYSAVAGNYVKSPVRAKR